MSHITSQRFVSTSAKPSIYSRIINITLLLLMVWFLVVSSLPLVVTPILLISLFILFFQSGFLPASLTGAFGITDEGILEYQNEKYPLSHVVLNITFIGVIICLSDKQRFFLWRDSVPDDEYRKLLVKMRALNGS
ncbi:protein YgfX [Vibrio lamellibrachiae]|uniref:protein YgfX n=1 Tax=Vibrio lamellibrachiae TaxID=2910253 RepID=UPI003D0C8980